MKINPILAISICCSDAVSRNPKHPLFGSKLCQNISIGAGLPIWIIRIVLVFIEPETLVEGIFIQLPALWWQPMATP